jgi:putative ABC transport system permease protein
MIPRLRSLWLRIVGLLRRKKTDAYFSAEIEAHLAFDIDDGIRSGLSEPEARRRALIRLGGMEQTRQAWRERNGLPWLESLLRDLRYSFRTLGKHKGVTAIAVLSIGLGIGANATIFSIVNRFVLRPAPVGDPSTLLSISTNTRGERCCNHFPLPVFEDVRDQAHSFSSVAGYYELVPASIGGNGEPQKVWGQGVTTNFFDVLELPMVLGRGFAGGEDSAPLIVLSETLWKSRFGADAQIVGKPILLSGRTFTVVGVAPAAFHSVDQILDTRFWVPLGLTRTLVANLPPDHARDYHWLSVVGRMRPGISRNEVAAELSTLADRFARSFPATDKDITFPVNQAGSLPPSMKGTILIFFTALSIVVLLVLSIAGANVANLLFAQAVTRQREMAVRLALGATRARLRKQLLLESLLLAVGGGVLGATLSIAATRGLSAFRVPAPIPLDLAVNADWRVLLFSFLLSVVCGFALGAGPAWAASRPQVVNALKGEDALARPGRRFTLRDLLVVGQIGMSVVLLTVTILFLRSLETAAKIDIGFRSQGLLMLSVDPRLNGYTAEQTSRFLGQLRERAKALPGVDAAVTTDVALLSGGNRSDGFTVAGQAGKDAAFTYADLYMVTPGYFEALSTPLVAGRDFRGEVAGSPRHAIVNKAFAAHLFGNTNPIGQHVNGGHWTYEIIGVAGNAKSRTLGEDARPILYRSLDQSIVDDPSEMGYTLLVHAHGDPAVLSEALRRQVFALDSGIAVYNQETMDEHVRTAYFLPRVAATLFGVFGAIGLLLAAVGLYGVMSYSVSRRTREIGIRMAVGAGRGTVERFIVRQGMVLASIALVLGWPVAWMLSKLSSGFLYGIQPHDPITFAAVPLVLAVIAVAACWIPARRAASINPIEALRKE